MSRFIPGMCLPTARFLISMFLAAVFLTTGNLPVIGANTRLAPAAVAPGARRPLAGHLLAQAGTPLAARATPSLRPSSPTALTAGSASPTPAPDESPRGAESPKEGWLWLVLMVAAAVVLWALSVWLVWRDVQHTPEGRRHFWLKVALMVPIFGYLSYLGAHYLWPGPSPDTLTSDSPKPREFIFLDADHRPIEIKTLDERSGLEDAKGVLQDALLDRASDVHIEPGATECRVRFRIDGVLHPRMKFTAEEGLRLISALKTVAELDIAERRKAQDGRFAGRTGGFDIDFRAATTPSVYGEKLVLRILDQTTGLLGLDHLGMSPEMMQRFAETIQSRSGMILATGPTGSGKTSSLYAALSQLDAVRLNIVTIEDPVEYELIGATQIPVNVKAGITYESGLRSILRQDPDVILVGEMRDLEAAQIALRSALTGHLVFSSLHTRDAVGTIQRLEEMGIERHLVASALLVVIAQRLVRKLCPQCRQAYACNGDELAEIGIRIPPGETIYRATGCRKCDGTGYIGRTGIFEMLIFDEDVRQEINAGTTEDTLLTVARAKGYRGYREDGAEKVLLGVTSIDEVLKAT